MSIVLLPGEHAPGCLVGEVGALGKRVSALSDRASWHETQSFAAVKSFRLYLLSLSDSIAVEMLHITLVGSLLGCCLADHSIHCSLGFSLSG